MMKKYDGIPVLIKKLNFSENDAQNIIQKTITTPKGKSRSFPKFPDPKTLAKDLNQAYREYLGFKDGWDKIPTSNQILKKLNDAKRKTERLFACYTALLPTLQHLNQVSPSPTSIALEENIEALIEEDLSICYSLIGAETARLIDLKHAALKRTGKKSLTILVGQILPEVYEDNFGKKIGKSVDVNGKPSGPYLSFAGACLKHLDIKITDESILNALRRKKK